MLRDPAHEPTICARASAVGGVLAVIRLSGPRCASVAERAGLRDLEPWRIERREWELAGGRCPCRLLHARAPNTYTGWDVIEITLPGSGDLVAIAVDALVAAGAEHAEPGAFTRQALANGRLTLPQAEAVLAVTHAPDAAAALRAIERLRGALSRDLGEARDRVLRLRALVEAGLDFLDEDDVRAYEPVALRSECAILRDVVRRWLVAAGSLEGMPIVCLAGPANAGKSALFARLTGADPLVSPIAGTTRDALEADAMIAGRKVRVVDTAGWMEPPLDDRAGLDAAGIEAGRRAVQGATLILACSAPDAPAPHPLPLPIERTMIVATKSDLRSRDARAAIAVSALSGEGVPDLLEAIAERLADCSAGDARQQRLLARADVVLARLAQGLASDDLLAEDLRQVSEVLGDVIGATTPDDVLEAIFSRFCIGK